MLLSSRLQVGEQEVNSGVGNVRFGWILEGVLLPNRYLL
jgi:hypothetical protein